MHQQLQESLYTPPLPSLQGSESFKTTRTRPPLMDANVCLLQCKRLDKSSGMDKLGTVTLPSCCLGLTEGELQLGAILLRNPAHSLPSLITTGIIA